LPEEKLRAVHGSWHPQDILSMVDLGVDIFDSSLASYATEEICALVFKYEAVPR
jgi:queuine/archaeosine tRNA-ribosyltransferase